MVAAGSGFGEGEVAGGLRCLRFGDEEKRVAVGRSVSETEVHISIVKGIGCILGFRLSSSKETFTDALSVAV